MCQIKKIYRICLSFILGLVGHELDPAMVSWLFMAFIFAAY